MQNREFGATRRQKSATLIVTKVGRETARSSIGIASSRMTVWGRNWVMSVTVPRYQRAIDAWIP
jgi:hypothetical protein